MPDQTSIDKYTLALKAITDRQSKIVGEEIALSLADSVEGVDIQNGNPKIVGDAKVVLGTLVDKYSLLFGEVSIEVSKDAVHEVVPELQKADLPANLQ